MAYVKISFLIYHTIKSYSKEIFIYFIVSDNNYRTGCTKKNKIIYARIIVYNMILVGH